MSKGQEENTQGREYPSKIEQFRLKYKKAMELQDIQTKKSMELNYPP